MLVQPHQVGNCVNISESDSVIVLMPATLGLTGYILVIPLNFIQLSQNGWKKLWLPVCHTAPFGGLVRGDETRAPSKLLGDCHIIDSQCSRLIFAGNDSSHCEISVCVLHAHRIGVIDFKKTTRLWGRKGDVTFDTYIGCEGDDRWISKMAFFSWHVGASSVVSWINEDLFYEKVKLHLTLWLW